MIPRTINIENSLEKNKAVIIYGPRQVGKTTLVKDFLSHTKLKYKMFSGDQLDFVNNFSKCDLELIKKMLGDAQLLVIDEAQKIENIGTAIKLIVDNIFDIYVITTGSSSFDLANATDEPLTGRKNLLTLYPIALLELSKIYTQYELEKNLREYLIYGTYPNIITYKTNEQKQNRINEIKDAYLIKDVLEFHGIKKSQVVLNLLKLLAFQLGSEVSTVELGRALGLDHKTILRYLELLEKSFVIFKLTGFSRNLRKEVSKMNKYYFYDLGIRNALISNFNDLDNRDDIGRLWENFLMIERMKRNSYKKISVNYYFWRTYDQKEIDLIEERGGKLYGYEFKWKQDKKIKPPSDWLSSYKNASYEIIDVGSCFKFVT
jgi:uncharacterized protein